MNKINDRPPNYRNKDGLLCIIRCFACEPNRGKENWAMAVASGQCQWCGWVERSEAHDNQS